MLSTCRLRADGWLHGYLLKWVKLMVPENAGNDKGNLPPDRRLPLVRLHNSGRQTKSRLRYVYTTLYLGLPPVVVFYPRRDSLSPLDTMDEAPKTVSGSFTAVPPGELPPQKSRVQLYAQYIGIFRFWANR